MGHEVQALGVHDDLGEIRRLRHGMEAAHRLQPARRRSTTSRSSTRTSVSYLELLKLPYTGCNPRGLLLARDKSLSKKLLAYHRMPVPEFEVFRIGRPVRAAEAAAVPADRQVADAGGVDRHLAGVGGRQRREAAGARRVHPREHRHGRDRRAVHRGARALRRRARQPELQALPVWELFFTNMPPEAQAHRDRPREVEREVPEEVRHRQRAGAAICPTAMVERIQHVCKRAFRALELSGYARIDLRLDAAGTRVGDRSEPESADRPRRGLRGVGREGRVQLRNAAAAHHQPRTALAARERRVSADRAVRSRATSCSERRDDPAGRTISQTQKPTNANGRSGSTSANRRRRAASSTPASTPAARTGAAEGRAPPQRRSAAG